MPDLTPVFSDPTPATCPECGGPQLVPHPAGLVYRHDTLAGCTLQAAEDARLVADKAVHVRPASAGSRGWASPTPPSGICCSGPRRAMRTAASGRKSRTG